MGRKTPQDPTGMATNRAAASKRLTNRLTRSERSIKDRFSNIPRHVRTVKGVTNADGDVVVTDYELTPEQMSQLAAEIRADIDSELGTEGDDRPPADWFWRDDVDQAYRTGAAEETINYNQLVSLAVLLGIMGHGGMQPQPVTIESVIGSRAYRDGLASVTVQNYGTMKTLSGRTADQVIQTINSGIQSKKSSADIAKEISERFNVSRSNAKRIADTEINKAYNTARIDTITRLSESSGLRAAVMHISALLPTTRDTHAARHGKVYTPEEQQQWWLDGTNSINCHCTVRSLLLGSNGRVVEREAR